MGEEAHDNKAETTAETTAETAKRQLWRDLIMKRYAQTSEDTEKWAANFEADLEAYVRARIAEQKPRPPETGTYGEHGCWEDARVTVTEILDDFYDDESGGFKQAFLDFERKLQSYFRYEHRGPEHVDDEEETRNIPDTRPQRKLAFVVYNDGVVWARLADRADAEAMVRTYDGEHHVWFEEEPEEPEDET